MSSLEEACVGHWKMNDDAATATVVDAMGDHNGTYKDGSGNINTSTGASTGKIGGALDFDGDEYVEIADHADFSFGDGSDDSPFSISAWIYIDNISGYFPIVGKWATGNKEWYLELYTGKATFYILGEGTIYRGRYYNTRLSTGQWYYVVTTYDGRGGASAQDGMKIYVNAVRKDDTDDVNSVYTAMSDGTAPVWIGRGDIEYANGQIDNVAIFNRVLTQREIIRLYNSGNGTEKLPVFLSGPPRRLLLRRI